MKKKIVATLTAVFEFDLNESYYPGCNTIDEMVDAERDNASDFYEYLQVMRDIAKEKKCGVSFEVKGGPKK